MLSGARGGHTLSYQQLARDGVRLLGRLADIDDQRLRFGPELPGHIEYADRRAAQFRHMVDDYVARTGITAPEPDTDPAERPQPGPGTSPETLSLRAERITTVIWCTGFGPDTGWLRVPVLGSDGSPAHRRGITALPGPRSPSSRSAAAARAARGPAAERAHRPAGRRRRCTGSGHWFR